MRTRNAAALATAIVVVLGGGVGYAVTRGSSPPPTTRVAVVPTASAATRPPVLDPLPTPSVTADAASVQAALRHLVTAPALGRVVSGEVVDADTGSPVYRRAAGTAVAPASTTKLMTATAALLTLGPDARLTTSTERVGSTVYLVGGGDVTLGAASTRSGYPRPASLADLARRTAAGLGGRRTVRLRVDTSAWSGPAQASGWRGRYFADGDVIRPTALAVDEGRVHPSTEEAPREPDPSSFAATQFVRLLRSHHITVRGQVRHATAPIDATRVAAVTSPPVAALVDLMLTTSDNDLAEALGRTVAIHEHDAPDFTGEARAITAVMSTLGIPRDEITLYDACGLSVRDRIAPAAVVDVLRTDATTGRPALRAVVAGLPVAGFSGTLAGRYRQPPASRAAGLLRAKTGTLTDVSALAGEVVDRDGQLLVFDFVASRAQDTVPAQDALDDVAARLEQCGCTD
jgi:D-alanyl-D-alanine carboxypeptidase/D-alanyl-D-alanine-endopeptidase (penicillin-binding protein 4)